MQNNSLLYTDLRDALERREIPLLLQRLPYLYPAYATTTGIWTSLAPDFEGLQEWIQFAAFNVPWPPAEGVTKEAASKRLVYFIGAVRAHFSRPSSAFPENDQFGRVPRAFVQEALEAAIQAHIVYRNLP
jgi:hypothetical protein